MLISLVLLEKRQTYDLETSWHPSTGVDERLFKVQISRLGKHDHYGDEDGVDLFACLSMPID